MIFFELTLTLNYSIIYNILLNFSAAESYAKWNPKSGIPPVLTENTHHSEDTFYPPSGTDLSFSCSALGQPEPSIIWLKNMVRIVLKLRKKTL